MNDSQIPARWLPFIRALWLVVVLLLLGVFFAGISPYFNELRVACTRVDCLMMALSPEEAQELRDLGLSMEFYAGYMVLLVIYAVVVIIPLAGLVFWRRSDTWMGLLLSLAIIFFGTASAMSVPALVSVYPSLSWAFFVGDFLSGLLYVLIFYLFPDGRFVPRWTRVLVMAMIGGFLIDLVLPIGTPITPSYSTFMEIFWLVGLMVGGWAQIYRYRRVSTAVQRQQTKWVMFGLIVMLIPTLIWSFTVELEYFQLQSGFTHLIFNFSLGIAVIVFTIFPLTVVFSILRYRLWDIDVIINRTLVYGLLTGVLALLYYGSVILFQSILRSITGEEYQIVVVASTLLIAVLFNPLRWRIQESIDRRFYRRKYDAEQVLAQFAATGREEVDLDRLVEALLVVVDETIQPEHVSLWLREPEPYSLTK